MATLGGIHPHRDRKSAEAVETKAVAECPFRKRVGNEKKIEELNEVKDKEKTPRLGLLAWEAWRRGV
jgi:hypothetical protein